MPAAIQNIRDFLNRKTPYLLSVHHDPVYRQGANDGETVAKACEVIAKDLAVADECGILPSYFPDFGTVSMPAVYGGEVIPARNGGGIHIKPAAKTADDILKLVEKPFEETDFQRAIGIYRKICERLETDEIYIRTPDFQGPMNTLALLLENQAELMVAMFEQPDVVHEAARKVTDMLIGYTARFRAEAGAGKVIGNIWPYIALPDGKGVGITQDYMPLLGPDQYAEFELPQLKRISDAFGGVFIHCCGFYKWHLKNLADSGVEIIGMECSNDHTPFSLLYEYFGDRIAINCGGQCGYPSLADYLLSFKGKPAGKARFWLCPCHEHDGGKVADRLKRALDELAEY